MYENIPSKSWKSSIFPINSPAELLSKPSKTFIMEKTLLPEDIIEGEVFRLGEDINNDPNAIFIEFSKSISLEKLLKIKNSSEAEKLSYTRHLADLIANLGIEGINNLQHILQNLITESDEIKLSLLSQIAALRSFLIKRQNGYAEILQILLPTLTELLSSDNLQIKEKAGEEVSNISSLLNEEDRGKYILTSVLGMAHNDLNENDRIVAVQLLSKMSTFFGKDLCEQFVGLELLSLGEDPQSKVRRETIIHLPTISKIVGPVFFKQRFFHFYQNLTNDSTWIVRKACVEILVQISEMCDAKVKETILTQLILKFLKDNNKWVKLSAYKQLGPFIHCCSESVISDKLLEIFCQMAVEEDFELGMSCAYNFPAVLQAVGARKWPVLFNTFQALLNREPEVKKPLACSLHEIAKIIGPDNSLKDLSFVFETFVTDSNDEMKYGIIKNLSKFLEVVSVTQRQSFIDIFQQSQKEFKKWRIRENVARQLYSLSLLYSKDLAFKILMPIGLNLCEDVVFIVRKKAAKEFSKIFLLFQEPEDLPMMKCLRESMIVFRNSDRFNMRQTFVTMMLGIMEEPAVFKLNFLEVFTTLVFDKCSNVRITLCRILLKHYKRKGKMRTDKYFIEMLEILKKDKISDVRELVSQILIFLPNSNKMELEETEDIKTFFSLHNASSNDNNNNFKTIYDNK